VRGGIHTDIVAEHRARGWKPQPGAPIGAGAPFDAPD